MANYDAELRSLIVAIASADTANFSALLSEKPELATVRFETANATRQTAKENSSLKSPDTSIAATPPFTSLPQHTTLT